MRNPPNHQTLPDGSRRSPGSARTAPRRREQRRGRPASLAMARLGSEGRTSGFPAPDKGCQMTVAFVLSGGASLGAVQVGMLQALFAHQIRPDAVIGTSAGAINASWIAGDPTSERLDDLADIWRALRRSHVFATGPVGLLGLLARRDGSSTPVPCFACSNVTSRSSASRTLPFRCMSWSPMCSRPRRAPLDRIGRHGGVGQRGDPRGVPPGANRRARLHRRWCRQQRRDLPCRRDRRQPHLRPADRMIVLAGTATGHRPGHGTARAHHPRAASTGRGRRPLPS